MFDYWWITKRDLLHANLEALVEGSQMRFITREHAEHFVRQPNSSGLPSIRHRSING
jgi:hypothetical protein